MTLPSGGSFPFMSFLALTPGTALAGIAQAHAAATTGAAATAWAGAGPIGIGALAVPDAAAVLLADLGLAHERPRAATALAKADATTAASTATVTDLVTRDETNAVNLDAAAVQA